MTSFALVMVLFLVVTAGIAFWFDSMNWKAIFGSEPTYNPDCDNDEVMR